MKRFLRYTLLLYLLASVTLFANVTTNTGSIPFDVDADSNEEMILTADGLGVGTSSPSANLHVQGDAIVSEEMSIGSSSLGSATLYVGGSMGTSPLSVDYYGLADRNSLVFADSQSGNVSLSLPNHSTVVGRVITVKKTHADHLVYIFGGGNIESYVDGFSLSSGNLGAVTFIATSDRWVILNYFGTTFSSVDRSWTPEDLDPILWFDASEASTITGSSPVTQWNDKSGNDRHVTSTGDPTLSSAVWNGLDAIAFDSNDHMGNTSLSLSLSSLQFAMVFQINTNGSIDYQAGFGLGGASDVFRFRESNNETHLQTVTDTGSGLKYRTTALGSMPFDTPVIGAYSYDGSQHSVHSNGISSGGGALTGTLDVTDVFLGKGTVNNLDGIVGEVLAVESTDSTIRERLEGYLANKWGLTSSLPLTHPYRNSPPKKYPILVSATADDPDDALGVIDAGDTITLVFDQDTNTPVVATKSDLDLLVDFGSNVLGTNYTGNWNGTQDTLTISVADATGADVGIGQTISILGSGNLTFLGGDVLSVVEGTLEGDFGPSSFEWSPGFVNTVVWYDASDASTITGSNPVTSWEDKSGNERHLAYSSDPVLSSALWNGLDAIDFDSNDHMGNTSLFLSLSSLQFAMVFQIDTDGSNSWQCGFAFEGASDEFRIRENNNLTQLQTVTDTGTGATYRTAAVGAMSFDAPFIGAFSYDGSLSSSHSNGVTSAQGALTGTLDVTDVFLGQDSVNNLNGIIGEAVAVESTDSWVRERLEGYLAHKWSLEGDLTSGHPYKNAQPMLYPIIVSATADDPDDADGNIDNGDTITLVFDADTNTPAVATSDNINTLLSFGSNVLGTVYSGSWTGSNVLTITIDNATNADIGIGQTISLLSGGNLTFSGEVQKSEATGTLTGDFGP